MLQRLLRCSAHSLRSATHALRLLLETDPDPGPSDEGEECEKLKKRPELPESWHIRRGRGADLSPAAIVQRVARRREAMLADAMGLARRGPAPGEQQQQQQQVRGLSGVGAGLLVWEDGKSANWQSLALHFHVPVQKEEEQQQQQKAAGEPAPQPAASILSMASCAKAVPAKSKLPAGLAGDQPAQDPVHRQWLGRDGVLVGEVSPDLPKPDLHKPGTRPMVWDMLEVR